MSPESTTGHPSQIEAVLFDMGGVIIELDALEFVLGPSDLPEPEMWNAWILCEAVKQYERGECTVEHFGEAIVEELKLEGTSADFIERFRVFPMGLYPGAVELVQSVPDTIGVGVLSNTNDLHWDAQKDADIVRSLFGHTYLSYEIGLVKPDRAIFDYAVADLGVAAERVLFIDDNQINVDGAIAAGLQSGLAKGPGQAADVLARFGVTK